MVDKTLDSDGNGTVDLSTGYVYDGNQIALQFDHTGTGDATASDLSHRYLWGAAVDQLLADEQVDSLQTAGDVVWPLVGHLNTVRNLATYDSNTDTTTIANHRVYDAYGNVKSQTNSAVDCVFGYTGRQFDNDTGLQNNLNRWYDAAIGRWMSKDPIGFNAGDGNVYRYVGNGATSWIDPSGLKYGDKFDSPDDTAIDWGKTYGGATIESGRERASTIFQTPDGKWTYTIPNIAEPETPNRVVPSMPTAKDNSVGVVAATHSHIFLEGNDGAENDFSDGDMAQSRKRKSRFTWSHRTETFYALPLRTK